VARLRFVSRLSSLLSQPEFIHAAINHLPLVGVAVAGLGVGATLFVKSLPALRVNLALLGLLSFSILPVAHFGEAGYDRVLSLADDAGQAFLRQHAQLADRWAFLYYLTALVAAAGTAASFKWPRALRPCAVASLVLAAASLVAGMAIAHSGGEIRHREFRTSPPPVLGGQESNSPHRIHGDGGESISNWLFSLAPVITPGNSSL
jgi:hypothetical protein